VGPIARVNRIGPSMIRCPAVSDGTPLAAQRNTWYGEAAVLLVALLLWAVRDLVVLVGLALVLAYALEPLVHAVVRVRIGRLQVSRGIASLTVVAGFVLVVAWLIAFGAPRLFGEVGRFLETVPGIIAGIAYELREYARGHGLEEYVGPTTDALRTSTGDIAGMLASAVAGGARAVFGGIGQLLGVLVLPLLSFYLLAEGVQVRDSMFRFVPAEHHARMRSLTTAVDRALRAYVRGQSIVCLVVGVTTGLVLEAFRFPYALLIGVLAGVAEVIPYLGFLIVAVAIAIAGLIAGPTQIVIGLTVYVVVNNVVGLLVTPRVMGRYLQLHPFVVTISVLAGGRLLGAAGVMVALPLAAVIQALVAEFAQREPARRAVAPPAPTPPAHNA
jgi:predicted PurR-regulated permease PerM